MLSPSQSINQVLTPLIIRYHGSFISSFSCAHLRIRAQSSAAQPKDERFCRVRSTLWPYPLGSMLPGPCSLALSCCGECNLFLLRTCRTYLCAVSFTCFNDLLCLTETNCTCYGHVRHSHHRLPSRHASFAKSTSASDRLDRNKTSLILPITVILHRSSMS